MFLKSKPLDRFWEHLYSNRYRRLKKRLYQLVLFHKNYRRFVVVGHPRTGSNFLTRGLATSENVRDYKELFAVRNRNGKDFHQIYELLFQRQPREVFHVGFKLFYDHFSSQEWGLFLNGAEFDVIHLTRRNRLRTIVSLDLAIKSNQWTSRNRGNYQNDTKNVVVDPETIVYRLQDIKQGEERLRKRLAHWRMTEVIYEEIVQNPEEEFHRLGLFLGITGIN